MKRKLIWLIIGLLTFGMAIPQAVLAKDNDLETRGFIAALSETSVTVGSVTWVLNGSTEYRDQNDNPISRTDFNIGDLVKVKGPNVNGQLIADELEFEDDFSGGDDDDDDDSGDDDRGELDRYIVRGLIEAISAGEIVVAGESFTLNGSTEYENEDDSPAAFGDFAVGDLVKVKGYPDGGGGYIAIEVEFEDDFNSGGDDRQGSERRNQTVRLVCSFPQLKTVKEGIEKSAKQALQEAGYLNVQVSSKTRLISRPRGQRVTGTSAAEGLGVVSNSTADGNALDIVGAINLKRCDGIARVVIRVRARSPLTGERFRNTLTREVDVVGVLAGNSRSR